MSTVRKEKAAVSGKISARKENTSISGKSAVTKREDGVKAMLFTTKTCPNCRIATKSLEKAHISYELVDAEENEDLVKQYGVMQAPTLVVVEEDGVKKMTNASNIKAYAENNKE